LSIDKIIKINCCVNSVLTLTADGDGDTRRRGAITAITIADGGGGDDGVQPSGRMRCTAVTASWMAFCRKLRS